MIPARRLVTTCILGALLVLSSCAAHNTALTDEMVMANLWMQTSAEYRALCYQAFNLARVRLGEAVTNHDGELPLAVVVDCDETVLSTTRYGSWMIFTGNRYARESWTRWLREDPAREVPGAGSFLHYAESRGVEVFYVTNRRAENNDATLAHLADLGFPNADAEHLLAQTETSDKTARRDSIAETHQVALLIGDSLTDFDQVFSGGDPGSRAAEVKEQAAGFGERFIVLPNATYGEWENVLYSSDANPSNEDISSRRRDALDPWQPGESRH